MNGAPVLHVMPNAAVVHYMIERDGAMVPDAQPTLLLGLRHRVIDWRDKVLIRVVGIERRGRAVEQPVQLRRCFLRPRRNWYVANGPVGPIHRAACDDRVVNFVPAAIKSCVVRIDDRMICRDDILCVRPVIQQLVRALALQFVFGAAEKRVRPFITEVTTRNNFREQ